MTFDIFRYIYDCEVFSHDWLFVFKDKKTKKYTIIHNEYDSIREFMKTSPLLGGFNCKHYDQFILRGSLAGFSLSEIKGLSDYMISGGSGWDVRWREYNLPFIQQYDLFDDCYKGLSLKAIEAHLGMPIVESSVDFNIDRPLTDDELEEVIRYCKYDVDATDYLDDLRSDYLANKLTLGQAKGIAPGAALGMTNAKLTAVYLDADPSRSCYEDEREYHYPDKLLKEYVPQEVLTFFDQMHDMTIERDDLFSRSLNISIGNCPCTVAFGGIHGAIPCYTEEARDGRHIRNKDVASYYPNLMIVPQEKNKKYGYISRAIPEPELFVNTKKERIQAKKNGDKSKNFALKLIINTAFGCMGNGVYKDGKYRPMNDLYDPLMARSVCITGQLFLMELAVHLVQECPSLRIIQLNTDGIMVSLDNKDEPKWQEITEEWQSRTGFELEEDFIQKICQRDVNNYIEISMDGKRKLKGGDLVRGISEAGAFKINNNATVIAKAIANYLADETPVEDTIQTEQDILAFQIIAKAGSGYDGCVQQIDGRMYPVQKVNRVYASLDYRNGTIYKTKAGKTSKIPDLPARCVVDNDNHLTIDAIDRDWYVRQAKKKIRAFLGMTTKKKPTRKINQIKKKILERMAQEWQQITLN